MYDPQTVAFDIKSPFRSAPSKFWPKGYRNTLVTIWHVDPERDGTDDSCGWFKRARHGDQAIRERIRKAFASEWDGEHTGWFDSDGMPVMSVQATALSMFQRAAYIYFGDSWPRADRFHRRYHHEIVRFAENRVDSMSDGLTQRFGPSDRDERIQRHADMVFSWILRADTPWYRHPRWHVWHWRLQVHPLQAFKRWAFSRCAECGRGFAWGESPISSNWDGTGPRWFRREHGVSHGACSRSQVKSDAH